MQAQDYELEVVDMGFEGEPWDNGRILKDRVNTMGEANTRGEERKEHWWFRPR